MKPFSGLKLALSSIKGVQQPPNIHYKDFLHVLLDLDLHLDAIVFILDEIVFILDEMVIELEYKVIVLE